MLAYILIAMGFLMRLIPHAPNMAPVAAIALFSGAYLNKKIVPWVPLAIMVLTDLIIGLHGVFLYTWGAFVIIGFMGYKLRQGRTPGKVLGMTVLSACVFFVISNFGVWLAWYPHTAQGFMNCFIKALPFFRNTMAVNIIFAFILFGTYELARKMVQDKGFGKVLIASVE